MGWWRTSPGLMSCQHLWAHSPAPCRALCPGADPPATPVCPAPLIRGWSWGGRRVACWWPLPLSTVWVIRVFDVVGVVAGRGLGCTGGRCRCRWCVSHACSIRWTCSVAEFWAVMLACPWSLQVLMVRHLVVFEVVGVVAGRGVGCPGGRWALLMVWASLVFEVVGVIAGRGLGCRVSCPRPVPRR